MRIAFFAKRKRRTHTTRSMVAALRRAGHRVRWLNERRRRSWVGSRVASGWVAAEARAFRADLVLIHADDIQPGTLERLAPHCQTALFTPDCWISPLPRRKLGLARGVDLLLTVAAGQVPEFEAAGVRAAWLPEACDPVHHHPVDDPGPEWHADVAFIGKANPGVRIYARRAALVQKLAATFDTKLYGAGWEAFGLEPQAAGVDAAGYRKACRGARVVVGRDWTDRCELYFSNRTWFTLGCGGFLLTNYVPGLETVFENGGQLAWYRSDDECLDLVRHYLARPDERARIAAAGRAFVLAHRTSDHFARDLVDRIEGRPPAFPPPMPG